jgi:hypothetical protein
MKKYIKPVSEVIQTEDTCFVQATVMRDMRGSDQPAVVGTIPVIEDRDPKGNYNAWTGDNLSEGGAWSSDT